MKGTTNMGKIALGVAEVAALSVAAGALRLAAWSLRLAAGGQQ